MQGIFSAEVGWQIALTGALGTFVILFVLKLIIEAIRVVLCKFGLDVEELTYIPPEMPEPEAEPLTPKLARGTPEVPTAPAPAAAVEQEPSRPSTFATATHDEDLEAVVAAIACALFTQETPAAAAPAMAPALPPGGVQSPWCMAGRLNLIDRDPKKRNR